MKHILNIIAAFLITVPSIAQSGNTLYSNEVTLPPSPMAASLGTYGGVDIKKYTGGLYKNLELFNLSSGEIGYSPSIFYATNGFRVDDWGSDMGIGWTHNLSPVITRTVYGIEDERPGAYSIRDFPMGSMVEMNASNLTRVEGLALSGGLNYDGEYDVFSYNLFGESGSFIIKNNQAVLLNHTTKVSIKILSTYPYAFEVRTSNGFMYSFGNVSSTELSRPDYDSPCNMSGISYPEFIATAWYVDRITSPHGDVLDFAYQKTAISRYLASYSEKTVFKWMVGEVGDGGFCVSDPATNVSVEDIGNHITQCARFRYQISVVLQSVTAKAFRVQMYYQDREDFFGQKLLTSLTIYNRNNVFVKHLKLNYEKVTADTPIEQNLRNAVGQDPDVMAGISKRYFLTSLAYVSENGNKEENAFEFKYKNLTSLPHRFSFSQDINGFYNGVDNDYFIPKKEAEEFTKRIYGSGAKPYGSTIYNLGNRKPDFNYATIGVLEKITYPTGGFETIIYEPHTRMNRKSVPTDISNYYDEHTSNSYNYSSYSSTLFRSGSNQIVKIRLSSDFYSPTPPSDDEGEIYYSLFTLRDVTTGAAVYEFNNGAWGPVIEERRIGHLHLQELYVKLEADHVYRFEMEVHGLNTVGQALVYDYSSEPDEIVRYNELLPGIRVKSNITSDGSGNQHILEYDYSHFDVIVDNGQRNFVLTDSASLNQLDYNNGFGDSYDQVVSTHCNPDKAIPVIIRKHYVSSQSKYDQRVFMGSNIAYTHITKKYIGDGGGFEAYEVDIASNEGGGVLLGDYTPSIPMSNLGWANGLEKKIYKGEINNDYWIVRFSKENFYDIDLSSKTQHYNYSGFKKYEGNFSFTGNLFYLRFTPYTLYYYPWLSVWYKLNATIDTYDDPNGSQLITRNDFKYSSTSGLLTERKTKDSKNRDVVEKTIYADDPLNPDAALASNIYLKDNFILSWPILRTSSVNGQTQSMKNTFALGENAAVLESSATWKNYATPQVTFKANSYNAYDKLLDYTRADGIRISYLWDRDFLYPIATVVGATHEEIAYTSFEGSNGNWSFSGAGLTSNIALTGKHSYNLNSGGVSISGLTSENSYIVSYWTTNMSPNIILGTQGSVTRSRTIILNNQSWTRFEHRVSGVSSINITGSGWLDEVRFHPFGAQMVTFVQEQQIGLLSQSDSNNRIIYYEYDTFKRLSLLRDEDGNILKKYCYKYFDQIDESCSQIP